MTPSPSIPSLTRHPSVPYTSPPSRLRTLDLWLPSNPNPALSSSTLPWLIYIHGGAWRDPTQTSTTVHPTLKHLSRTHPSLLASRIAGIASLNYRLSPYADHATDPSDPADADRNVQHPTHVNDVLCALRWLVKEYGVRRWIGLGHSCGATLLLQAISGSVVSVGNEDGGNGEEEVKIPAPDSTILLSGIYDIAGFRNSHTPPTCTPEISAIYASIVRGAFGADESAWDAASPAKGALSGHAVDVVLGWGEGDVLVELGQREEMLRRYLGEGWVERGKEEGGKKHKVVEVVELRGEHDEVWEDGAQVAELITEALGRVERRMKVDS